MTTAKTTLFLFLAFLIYPLLSQAQDDKKKVPEKVMQQVYEEVKTPYKYGLVLIPQDSSKMMDSPSVFKKGKDWYMTYIVFDGKGYETWLAKSADLLHWETQGTIMSFSDTSTTWDGNQKAGYIALLDNTWGGSYAWQPYNGNYWMSYLGGASQGYEAGLLSIGIASTEKNPTKVHEWHRMKEPVLKATDEDVRWWENSTLFKSSVIWDKSKLTGYPFVMYYNARGDSLKPEKGAERIGMAVSNDMENWQRFGKSPVINHHTGISGDAYLQKMDDLWVMFYFGAFWKEGAFNRFACSYNLINWTDWQGEDLIAPSEPYDDVYAHKSFVVKYDGVVYHFYCAVNKNGDRGIAVATSKDMGESGLRYRSQLK